MRSEVKPRSATQMTFEQGPFAQVRLDLADQAGAGGVPGPGPDPDRDPVAGDGHADDDLREVVAGVLGLAVGAEPGLAGPPLVVRGHPDAPGVAGNVLVCLFRLEIGAGRVEEKQVDFKIQQVGDLVVGLLGQAPLDGQEVVHGPVAGVVGDLVQPVDVHVAADPVRGGELGGRGQGTVRGQGEQDPLGLRAEPAPGHGPADGRVQAEPAPQLVQDVDPAGRARRGDRQLARLRRGQCLRGVQQPGQGRDQAADGVLVELVLPAEVVQHPRARPLRLGVPLVVGQLQVADRPGTGGPHGRLHVGHAPEATGTRTLGQIR